MNNIVLPVQRQACNLRTHCYMIYLTWGWAFFPKGVCNHCLNKGSMNMCHMHFGSFLCSSLHNYVKKSLMGLIHVSAARAECLYEKYTQEAFSCITQSPGRKYNLEDFNREGHKIIQWRNSSISVCCVGRDVLSMGALLNSSKQFSLGELKLVSDIFLHKTIKPKLVQ